MVKTCETTILIKSIADRISARMQVREAARNLRFPPREQARISLVAYSVITWMNMGAACDGEVLINHLQKEKREGVQITFTTMDDSQSTDVTSTSFSDARWLIDELNVEKVSPKGERVVAVLWTG